MPVFTSDVTVNSTVGLTDTELRATPLPISGTITATPTGTQDVNLVSTIAVPVTGTFFQATQPVSGPLTDAQLRATPVPVATTPVMASTATITRVATSGSSVLLLAANANRKGFIVMTETGTANYVALAATASLTAYTYFLGSASVLEKSGYTGPVALIRSSGSGNVQITELV